MDIMINEYKTGPKHYTTLKSLNSVADVTEIVRNLEENPDKQKYCQLYTLAVDLIRALRPDLKGRGTNHRKAWTALFKKFGLVNDDQKSSNWDSRARPWDCEICGRYMVPEIALDEMWDTLIKEAGRDKTHEDRWREEIGDDWTRRDVFEYDHISRHEEDEERNARETEWKKSQKKEEQDKKKAGKQAAAKKAIENNEYTDVDSRHEKRNLRGFTSRRTRGEKGGEGK